MTVTERFVKKLNNFGLRVHYQKDKNILWYLEFSLIANNEESIKYIIQICLYNDKYDFIGTIKNSKASQDTKDFSIKFINNEIDETIKEIYQVDSIVIWIVDNFPEKETDVYRSLLECGYEESVDWIISRVGGYKQNTYKVLDLAIQIEAPSYVIKNLWNLYKQFEIK